MTRGLYSAVLGIPDIIFLLFPSEEMDTCLEFVSSTSKAATEGRVKIEKEGRRL